MPEKEPHPHEFDPLRQEYLKKLKTNPSPVEEKPKEPEPARKRKKKE